VGFYTQQIVPRVIHRVMREELLIPLRQRVVGQARGRVIEIGIGSGLNLPFYGREVTSLHGVDPSPHLLGIARRTAGWLPFPVTLLEQTAEYLPLAEASMDAAVVTWSLCSIPDAMAALKELRRVLVPGGRLLFVEHGLSSSPRLAAWQRRLTPAWRRLAGGCHLDRRMDRLLERAGFALAELETGHLLPGPRLLTFHYLGTAISHACLHAGGWASHSGLDRSEGNECGKSR
jgi:ubiquinone/menaquinone biosynthesis C-methylase UbiE